MERLRRLGNTECNNDNDQTVGGKWNYTDGMSETWYKWKGFMCSNRMYHHNGEGESTV